LKRAQIASKNDSAEASLSAEGTLCREFFPFLLVDQSKRGVNPRMERPVRKKWRMATGLGRKIEEAKWNSLILRRGSEGAQSSLGREGTIDLAQGCPQYPGETRGADKVQFA